jgi:hypothetical protein
MHTVRAVQRLTPVHQGSLPENESGQVAQVVERSPEKAGVGGSTPSLATISNYCKNCNSERFCVRNLRARLIWLPSLKPRRALLSEQDAGSINQILFVAKPLN